MESGSICYWHGVVESRFEYPFGLEELMEVSEGGAASELRAAVMGDGVSNFQYVVRGIFSSPGVLEVRVLLRYYSFEADVENGDGGREWGCNYRVELLVKSKGEWLYESVMRGMSEGRGVVEDGDGNQHRSVGFVDVFSLQEGAQFVSEDKYEDLFRYFVVKFDCLSDAVLVGTFMPEEEGEPQVYKGYKEREMGGVYVSSLEVAKPPTPRPNHERAQW
ncbi:hypothetical protein DPV78_003418 [Talaromyces pinophilus]|nr:hypothetical protein DPV78_003418 [Talaromyces pinophilus]